MLNTDQNQGDSLESWLIRDNCIGQGKKLNSENTEGHVLYNAHLLEL